MAQIQLGGSIGVPGSAPILGNISVTLVSNTHTLTATEWSNYFLEVTGALTGTGTLICPLQQGQTFLIQNATTGGHSITVIGSSGTGVSIASGATTLVCTDATNYFAPNATGSGFAASGDLSGTSSSQTVIGIQNEPVLSTIPQDGYGLFYNGSSWAPTPFATIIAETGAWQTALDIDMTNQGNQVFPADGNYTLTATIGGTVTFTKINTARETSGGLSGFVSFNGFTVPAVGSNVTVTTIGGLPFAPGNYLFLQNNNTAGAFVGMYLVVSSVPTDTYVIKNLGGTWTNSNAGSFTNIAPGSVVPNYVCPSAYSVIVQGVGLCLSCNADGIAINLYENSRNTIGLTTNISSLVPNFDPSTNLRAWAYLTTANETTAGNFCTLALEALIPNPNSNYQTRRNNISGTREWQVGATFNGAVQIFNTGSALTSENVQIIETKNGMAGGNGYGSVGTYSAGWPALSSLNPLAYAGWGTSDVFGQVVSSIGLANTWDMLIGVGNADQGASQGAAGYQATIARMRLDYRY